MSVIKTGDRKSERIIRSCGGVGSRIKAAQCGGEKAKVSLHRGQWLPAALSGSRNPLLIVWGEMIRLLGGMGSKANSSIPVAARPTATRRFPFVMTRMIPAYRLRYNLIYQVYATGGRVAAMSRL